MKCDVDLGSLDNLHCGLAELLEKKKLNLKGACYISGLDIDAEQLWALYFYNDNGLLPIIGQRNLKRPPAKAVDVKGVPGNYGIEHGAP